MTGASAPSDPQAFLDRVDSLARERKFKDLARLPESFRGDAAETRRILVAAATRLYVGDRVDLGAPLVASALETGPEPPLATGLQAMAAMADEEYDRAFELLLAYVERSGGDPDLWVLRSVGDRLVEEPPERFDSTWPCPERIARRRCEGAATEGSFTLPEKIRGDGPEWKGDVARRRGGKAVLGVVITPDGRTVPLRTLETSSWPVARALAEKVRTWAYEPARLDGEPVSALAEVGIRMYAWTDPVPDRGEDPSGP